MDDLQLLRYNRHLMLPQFGIEGQERLAAAHVLIIGIGGLGSPAAMYLAAAGTGRLTLADPDRVELTNLQRQILHRTGDVGSLKVESAERNLLAINPDIRVDTIDRRMDDRELNERTREADLVLDATDNFDTRYRINRACIAQRTPLVSAAAIRFEGQISVFDTRRDNCPCYQCLYPAGEYDVEETCSENGILAPVVGVLGSLQALEAIKLLCGIGENLAGRLLILDALTMQWRSMRLKRDPACPACRERGVAAVEWRTPE